MAKKASSVTIPLRAEHTGLVFADWKVDSDDPEGVIDLARLDFRYDPVFAGEGAIKGDTLLSRARSERAMGSLGLTKLMLDAQKGGKSIIPSALCNERVRIIFPRTQLLDHLGKRQVAALACTEGLWEICFSSLDGDFRPGSRLVRLGM